MASIRRIRKELTEFQNDPPQDCQIGEISGGDAGDPTHWDLTLVGPKETPYTGGLFSLTVDFPAEYPFKPPSIIFKTPIYHLNIDRNGKICLDIFKDNNNIIIDGSKS